MQDEIIRNRLKFLVLELVIIWGEQREVNNVIGSLINKTGNHKQQYRDRRIFSIDQTALYYCALSE